MRHRHNTLLLVLILIADAITVAPQEPRFTSESNLVLIPVVVRDKTGKHVSNISQDAFTVFRDGTRRKISLFEEVHSIDQPIRPVAYKPGEFGNDTSRHLAPRRLVVLLVHGINTSAWLQQSARSELLKFIEHETISTEPVGIVLLD